MPKGNPGQPKTRIHYTGYPCKIDQGRWKSVVLHASTNPDRVTCKTCVATCKKIAIAWIKTATATRP